jgi:hypothetical protein
MTSILWALVAILACKEKENTCDPVAADSCDDGLVCEEVEGGEPACFPPVAIEGRVFDLETDDDIGSARVSALDANGSPASSVALSDSDGTYALSISAVRDDEGEPVRADVTLRADASGYVSFPSGVRTALPIDLSAASASDDGWTVALPSTDLGLVEQPDGTGTASVHGTVETTQDGAGVLVVVEQGGEGTTAIADLDGSYAVFNLASGSADVTAYARGASYEREVVDLEDDAATEVDLARIDDATGTVAGNVQIVNAPGGAMTSVILVVESTFDDVLARGEMPPGLRAPSPPQDPNVSGDYAITGVPAGRYVLLASFENDDLVRDPDTSIGGTQIQHIEVASGQTVSAEGFKVTEALGLTSPGSDAPEMVTEAPLLRWEDDSSEDAYSVEVFDALGQLVWSEEIDGVSGDDPSLLYGGPLESGMYYQFRVTSIKDGVPISRTEDLRGVFWMEPQP